MKYSSKGSLATVIFSCLTLAGCYLDKGDEQSFPEYMLTGTLIDSPVSAMPYQIGSDPQKYTNFQGQFSYEEGDLIRFYIGNYALPAVAAQRVITPLNLMGSDDINNRKVINLAFLLQALDSDQNPENGIEITDTLYGASFDFDFDQEFFDFIASPSVDELIWSYLGGSVPEYTSVVDHLNRNLGLRGTWQSDSATLSFLTDNAFLYVDDHGYEYGQYSHDSAAASVTLSVTLDYNGNAGVGPQNEISIEQLNTTTLMISDSVIPADYRRTTQNLQGLQDTWLSIDADNNDRYILLLLEDGRYQLTRASEEDGGGVDQGSWTMQSGKLALTSTGGDTDVLGTFATDETSRSYAALVSDDELTLSVDVSIVFVRQ